LGEILDRAREAVRAKRYDEAASLLEELLTAQPRNLRALDLAGFVEFFRGNHVAAEGFCRRALAIEPDHAYALSGLGSCLSRQGRIEEALPCFARAIELRPDWFEPWYDMAVALDRGGRREQALELLLRAAESFPEKKQRIDGLAARIRSRIQVGKGVGMADDFKVCTLCGTSWPTRAAFLGDPEVRLIGYQPDFAALDRGALSFNHDRPGCETTLEVAIQKFADLYDGPVHRESLHDTNECNGHCLTVDNLTRCHKRCANAWAREVARIVAEWE